MKDFRRIGNRWAALERVVVPIGIVASLVIAVIGLSA
jgi:hypothetical protein